MAPTRRHIPHLEPWLAVSDRSPNDAPMASAYEVGTRAWQPDAAEGWVASELINKSVDGPKAKLVFQLENGEVRKPAAPPSRMASRPSQLLRRPLLTLPRRKQSRCPSRRCRAIHIPTCRL